MQRNPKEFNNDRHELHPRYTTYAVADFLDSIVECQWTFKGRAKSSFLLCAHRSPRVHSVFYLELLLQARVEKSPNRKKFVAAAATC